jgi:hypothetical protein
MGCMVSARGEYTYTAESGQAQDLYLLYPWQQVIYSEIWAKMSNHCSLAVFERLVRRTARSRQH